MKTKDWATRRWSVGESYGQVQASLPSYPLRTPDDHARSNAAFAPLKEEIETTFGDRVDLGEILAGAPGQGWPREVVEWRGNLYVRSTNEPFFSRLGMEAAPLEGPDILCQCGATVFELHYGDGEIVATCPFCGLSESVYSG